jgi:hypothetical protein
LSPKRERRVNETASAGPKIDRVDVSQADHRRSSARERRREARDYAPAVGAHALDRAPERRPVRIAAHPFAASTINSGAVMGSAEIELPCSDQS